MLTLFDTFSFVIGIIIGFVVSIVVLKRSINKTGYGELKMCKHSCPYYPRTVDREEDQDDEQ